MSRRTGQSLRIAAIALFGGGLAPTGWAQVLYRVTPLADVPGGVGLCQAEDLNDAGQITGTVRTATSVLAVVWDTPTLVRPLPPAAGQIICLPKAINNAGHVAGVVNLGSHQEAFLYTRQDGTFTLGRLPNGDQYSAAFSLNDLDEVVGASGDDAFRWTPSGGMVALGSPPGGDDFSTANDINDAGFAVGNSGYAAGVFRAALWDPGGGIHWLPDLPDESGYPFDAFAINESGQCLGQALSAGSTRPFVWDTQTGHTLLPALAGCGPPRPRDINDAGQAVGSAHDRGDCGVVWVWIASAGMQVVNDRLDPCVANEYRTLLWDVAAINNSGAIVASVYSAPGSVLLTPYHAGDTDLDGDTDLNDLTVLLSHYGSIGSVTFAQGDVDEDGDVDIHDLTLLLARFGMTCA
jgi:uncharacterized membrane protein